MSAECEHPQRATLGAVLDSVTSTGYYIVDKCVTCGRIGIGFVQERTAGSFGQAANILENLPTFVRNARAARGLSQSAAALEMGLAPVTLMRLEIGDKRVAATEQRGPKLPVLLTVLRWLEQQARPLADSETA